MAYTSETLLIALTTASLFLLMVSSARLVYYLIENKRMMNWLKDLHSAYSTEPGQENNAENFKKSDIANEIRLLIREYRVNRKQVRLGLIECIAGMVILAVVGVVQLFNKLLASDAQDMIIVLEIVLVIVLNVILYLHKKYDKVITEYLEKYDVIYKIIHKNENAIEPE